MKRAEDELARESYGYGCWKAPYCFIGPEQGQAADENNNLANRHKAFVELQTDGLSDCGAFHDFIHEPRWHRAKPALQRTWSRLIRLLLTFDDKDTDNNEILRIYQRDRWGRQNGETCVIELSGLPARNLEVQRNRERYRPERIKFIRDKLFGCHPAPTFVVMYGKGAWEHYEKIAGIRLHPHDHASPHVVRKVKSTIFAFAEHPVSWGLRNKYWVELGEEMRKKKESNV